MGVGGPQDGVGVVDGEPGEADSCLAGAVERDDAVARAAAEALDVADADLVAAEVLGDAAVRAWLNSPLCWGS